MADMTKFEQNSKPLALNKAIAAVWPPEDTGGKSSASLNTDNLNKPLQEPQKFSYLGEGAAGESGQRLTG